MSTTKLTLSVREDVVKRAKRFAKRNHTSVSHLVESYLDSISQKPDESEKLQLLHSIAGQFDLPENVDIDAERRALAEKKYL